MPVKQAAQNSLALTSAAASGPTQAVAQPDNRVRPSAQVAIDGSPRQTAQRQEKPVVPNRTGLPDNLKSGVESLSGHSLDDVKVHYNSAKPALLQAHAYAQGTNIHIAPGQEQHLPHEAWHIAQQKQGRVRPTMQLKGTAVNDDHGLEREADVMGARAAAGAAPTKKRGAASPSMGEARPVQRRSSQPVVQRTVWQWDGEKWVKKGGSSEDDDEHDPPGKGGFRKLEHGDRYDQNDGKLDRRAQRLRGRMGRAEERQKKRVIPTKRGQDSKTDYAAISKKRGNRVVHATPFGSMRFGRGKFNTQPYGSFDPADWPTPAQAPAPTGGRGTSKAKSQKKPARPKSLGTNYDIISGALEGIQHSDAVLNEVGQHLATTGAPQPSALALTQPQRQAATGLASLLSVAEPHDQRNPTGGKVERAAIRYARDKGIRRTFNRKNGAYVPAHATAGGAARGGTGAFRDMRSGSVPLPLSTLDMLEYMSDSSADEATPEAAEPVVKKRRVIRRKAAIKPEREADEDLDQAQLLAERRAARKERTARKTQGVKRERTEKPKKEKPPTSNKRRKRDETE